MKYHICKLKSWKKLGISTKKLEKTVNGLMVNGKKNEKYWIKEEVRLGRKRRHEEWLVNCRIFVEIRS